MSWSASAHGGQDLGMDNVPSLIAEAIQNAFQFVATAELGITVEPRTSVESRRLEL